jgi:hypothetical protein
MATDEVKPKIEPEVKRALLLEIGKEFFRNLPLEMQERCASDQFGKLFQALNETLEPGPVLAAAATALVAQCVITHQKSDKPLAEIVKSTKDYMNEVIDKWIEQDKEEKAKS